MQTYIREKSGHCYAGLDSFTCVGEAIAFYIKPENTKTGLDMLFWRNSETMQPEIAYSFDKGGILPIKGE